MSGHYKVSEVINKVRGFGVIPCLLVELTDSEDDNAMPEKWTWSGEETELLIGMYSTHTRGEIAIVLERTEGSIRSHCYMLGLNTKKHPGWSKEELEKLRVFYEAHAGGPVPLADFAVSMGRRKSNVSRKAKELGLTDARRKKNRPGVFVRPHRFATDDEHRAWRSENAKKWIAEHGHPRGALGMKHTPEALGKMRAATARYWETVTPEKLKEKAAKMVQTKLAKYGTAGISGEQPYSRCRGGKREDLGDRYFRSAWEANYARYLDLLVEQKQISSWEYEPEVFRFEGVKRGPYTYTPDFRVIENDGRVIWHEVKGWMDSASRSRLKRMQKHYPLVEIRVIAEAEYRDISRIAGLIRGWEY